MTEKNLYNDLILSILKVAVQDYFALATNKNFYNYLKGDYKDFEISFAELSNFFDSNYCTSLCEYLDIDKKYIINNVKQRIDKELQHE